MTTSIHHIRPARCFILCCMAIALAFTTQGQTQRKLLAPTASKVQKTGYIDHARLHAGFKALRASADSARTGRHAVQQKAINQRYERRIMDAINQVAAEEGLTDIRPLNKDSVAQKNNDITDKVLKKLN